jgi:hypothetical protein
VTLPQIHLVITHGGKAHRDDFLSVGFCLAIGLFDDKVRVLRRQPTEEELADPGVLVLDVGGRLEPHRMNFDHHQLPVDGRPDCTLSLLARHFRRDDGTAWADILRLRAWFEPLAVGDHLGPSALARHLGLSRLPSALLSPVERVVLEKVGQDGFTPAWLELTRSVMHHEMEKAGEVADSEATRLERIRFLPFKGRAVALVDFTELAGLTEHLQSIFPPVCVSVVPNSRGPGQCLMRLPGYEEHIDFRRLSGSPVVEFVHATGFLCVTRRPVADDEVLGLVAAALVQESAGSGNSCP